ncbi:MAG: restriction endonuclease [Actinomycetia bacterium]|nr:restriction endonuclease [Actinomycetes bacterium]
MADIDELLSSTIEIDAGLQFEPVDDAGWDALGDHWQQIQGLLSTDVPGNGRWSDMGRHLHFAEPHDLRDIVVFDWPSVRQSILDHVFRDDPLPVEAADLAELSATEPTGPVTTELNWSVLDPDGFERVVLEIVVSSDGYENAKRLMSVNAPDKGRDLSADRIVSEALGGTQRLPVMIQCKHHQSRSVDLDDCVKSLEQAKLWPDAGFRVIVMATSGNFTQQAVEWVEKRAADGEFPAVELLGQSDLERLLAAKPAIRTAFGL